MALERILKTSKALGDETRLGIFRYLTTRSRPVAVSDVSQAFGLHPNAARAHLRRLEEAGLAASHSDRDAPTGRPPRLYRATAEGMAPIFEPASFKALASLLLSLLAELEEVDAERVEAFGRRWGLSYASRWSREGAVEEVTAGYVLQGLAKTLAGWGFGAERIEEGGPEGAIQINRCPFEDLAGRFPGLVCPLIRGVLQGMLQAVRPDLAFAFLREEEPQGCGCRITLPPPDAPSDAP